MNRSKNFEKSGEYASAWKKDEDGKMAVDGPRVVVGDQSQVPQSGIITRLGNISSILLGTAEALQCLIGLTGWLVTLSFVKRFLRL